MGRDFARLRDVQRTTPQVSTSEFMVPYIRNVNFTGREELLADLCTKLNDDTPKKWNHRVALYGLGGVGKTQVALEYVYTHRNNYDLVVWISAASETTLLSGFQEIAKKTNCISYDPTSAPSAVAQGVVEWLNRQESWLLVFDNLDQIEVVDGYLPK